MNKKSFPFLATFLIVPLLSSTTNQSTLAEANVVGDYFNKDTHNVRFVMAETHLNSSSYYVSEEGKLYGTSSLDYDEGRTRDPELVANPSAIHRIHDYISLLENERVADIELNQNYRMLVTESGKVLVAGFNGGGQLGAGDTQQISKLTDITSVFGDLGEDKIVSLTTAGNYTHALTEQGQVFSYGTNYIIGNNTSISYSPVRVPVNITSFFVDYDRTVDKIIKLLPGLALTESGVVYGWGLGFSNYTVPTIIFDQNELEDDEKIVDAIATGTGAILLTSEGRLFGRGTNTYYQLGLSDTTINYTTFTEINPLLLSFSQGVTKVSYITNGFLFSEDNQVVAWGTNKDGVAGTNLQDDRSISFTNVTENVYANVREGEYFVSAFKSGNPNNGSSSTFISNLGVVYGLGGLSTLGFPLDGTNLPIRTPKAMNPTRVTYTIDTSDGFDVGSFSWPYGYRVLVQNVISANVLNTTRLGYAFAGLYFDEALTDSVYDSFNFIAEENLTLYPKWIMLTTNVTYLANIPGQMSHNNPNTLTGDRLPYTLLPATATGYTFEGWFTKVQYTTEVTEINGTNYAQFIMLYAKFTHGGSGTSSGNSIPSSEGGVTPRGVNPAAVVVASTVATAAVGGSVYWFVIAKKSIAELVALFTTIALAIKVFFIGLFKKKKDKKDS